ncbi:hypothetical protein V2G26_013078 [Clonostachys chloroleuca]
MPRVAIAGGSSASLGRANISSILLSPIKSHWQVSILSRSDKKPLCLRALDPHGLRTRMEVVDYRDVSSIKAALARSHTLISVTSVIDGSQVQVETNLLTADVQAGCVRFAPSQWGFGPKGWENMDHFRSIGQPICEEFVRCTGEIECAKFNMGAFMNYIGLGAVTNSSTSDLTEQESI